MNDDDKGVIVFACYRGRNPKPENKKPHCHLCHRDFETERERLIHKCDWRTK